MSTEAVKGKVYVENRQLVLPGDLLAEGEFEIQTPYIYKVDDKYYSAIIGLTSIDENKLNIIPLEGFYLPKVGDLVIGLIIDVGITNWIVDIRAPYRAIMNASDALNRQFNPIQDDLRKYFDVGDYVLAKISVFDRVHNPVLTIKDRGLGKIVHGRIIEIQVSKVPRVIGKKRTMINMLMNETGCDIVVAQNGRIWINCSNKELEDILILALKKIEAEAHTTGLTDRTRNFIREEKARRGL